MPAKLLPRQLLDQFLERADAAGQGNEGVRAFEHQPLAFMHVVGHDQLLRPGRRMFAFGEKIRDDAGDGSAMFQRRAGHRTHQSDRAAAIDEPDAAFGQRLAKSRCSFDEMGICTGAGAAIDTDGFDFAHEADVALRNEGVKPCEPAARTMTYPRNSFKK